MREVPKKSIHCLRANLSVTSGLKNSKCTMIDWGVPVHLPHHLLSGLLILLAQQCWCSTTWLWTAQCLAEATVLEVWNTCPIKWESLEKSKVSSYLAPFFSRARGCWGGSLLMLELWSYEIEEDVAPTHDLKDEFCFKSFWYSPFYYTQVEYYNFCFLMATEIS